MAHPPQRTRPRHGRRWHPIVVAMVVTAVLALGWVAVGAADAAPLTSRTATKLSVNAVGGTGRLTLSGRLANPRNNQPVPGATIGAVLDESITGTSTTSSSGAFSITLAVPADYPAGTYTATVSFGGDERWGATYSTVRVNIAWPTTKPAATGTTAAVPPAQPPGSGAQPSVAAARTVIIGEPPRQPAPPGNIVAVTGQLSVPESGVVAGAPIEALVPGGGRGHGTTNTAGRFTVQFQVPATAKPGALNVTVRFTGSPGLGASSTVVRVPVRALRTAAPTMPSLTPELNQGDEPSVEVEPSASPTPVIVPTVSAGDPLTPTLPDRPTTMAIGIVAGFVVLVCGVWVGQVMVKRRQDPTDRFIDDDGE